MARVHTVGRTRTERKCGKCGTTIARGQGYRWAAPGFRAAKKVRCMAPACSFRPSELTASLLSNAYAAREELEDVFDGLSDSLADARTRAENVNDAIEEVRNVLESAIEQCAQEIRYVAEEYRDAAEAMGEAGSEHEERADALESTADEIDNLTSETPLDSGDVSDWKEEDETDDEAADRWLGEVEGLGLPDF